VARIISQIRARWPRVRILCWERVSCPCFEAGLLSAMFVVCSGDHACFGSVFCGRRT
jgi:hypothetical protein